MTLKKYAKSISELAEKHPDLLVVYSADDEGNSFHKLNRPPTLGFFEPKHGDYFYPLDHVKQYPEEYEMYANTKPNAVCLN